MPEQSANVAHLAVEGTNIGKLLSSHLNKVSTSATVAFLIANLTGPETEKTRGTDRCSHQGQSCGKIGVELIGFVSGVNRWRTTSAFFGQSNLGLSRF